MLGRLKNLILVGGWKSIFGGALILASAALGGSDCVDIECTQQITQLYKTGEAFLGVGLAHKLQKLAAFLKPFLDAAKAAPEKQAP